MTRPMKTTRPSKAIPGLDVPILYPSGARTKPLRGTRSRPPMFWTPNGAKPAGRVVSVKEPAGLKSLLNTSSVFWWKLVAKS